MGAAPEAEDLMFPSAITITKGPKSFKRHIYADRKGDFHPSPPLNKWEQMTLEVELSAKGFKGWLRNPVRKDWSLGVPYDQTGISSVMYPDFLVFRSGEGGGVFVDILEPHAPTRVTWQPNSKGSAGLGSDMGVNSAVSS
jgi:type III restriction enzyme